MKLGSGSVERRSTLRAPRRPFPDFSIPPRGVRCTSRTRDHAHVERIAAADYSISSSDPTQSETS